MTVEHSNPNCTGWRPAGPGRMTCDCMTPPTSPREALIACLAREQSPHDDDELAELIGDVDALLTGPLANPVIVAQLTTVLGPFTAAHAIVLRGAYSAEDLHVIAEHFRTNQLGAPLIICLDHDDDLTALDPDKMRAAGWVRA